MIVLILISYNRQVLEEPTPDGKEAKSASSIAKIRLSIAALASVRLVEDVTSNRTCLLLSLICSEKGEGIEIPKCTVSNKKACNVLALGMLYYSNSTAARYNTVPMKVPSYTGKK